MSIQIVEIAQPSVIDTVAVAQPSTVAVVEIRQGPAGTGGGGSNSVTSATTSDGTADLDLLNVTTATATVSGTLTADHIHGNLAGSVYAHVRAGENLAKGDPVYVSGSHGSGSTLIPIVSKADASNAAKMPAIGIMDAGVTIHNNGHMVIVGTITELNTAAYSVNAELYVASGGGFTATPPTARAQPVARVERANANNGAVIVKVNGLSASDATASTLVRRDASGGADFAGTVNMAIGIASEIRFEDYQAAAGATFVYNDAAAASAHRFALNGGAATGDELFTAATPAAARVTALNEILKYDPNAAATRTNPAAQAADDVLTGINLTAGIWEIHFYFSFSAGAGGVLPNLLFGTPANVDLTNLCDVGYYYHLNQGINSLRFNLSTGVIPMLARNNTPNAQYTGSFTVNLTGSTSLAMTFARNTDVSGATITRRAGAFLRARRING